MVLNVDVHDAGDDDIDDVGDVHDVDGEQLQGLRDQHGQGYHQHTPLHSSHRDLKIKS